MSPRRRRRVQPRTSAWAFFPSLILDSHPPGSPNATLWHGSPLRMDDDLGHDINLLPWRKLCQVQLPPAREADVASRAGWFKFWIRMQGPDQSTLPLTTTSLLTALTALGYRIPTTFEDDKTVTIEDYGRRGRRPSRTIGDDDHRGPSGTMTIEDLRGRRLTRTFEDDD
ncbi:hypothetical protein BDZ89DRAFT_1113322 [Hymenopellis radicata]|nr:hypothetical protein BDZ89DRAFT_1113322 [Hymenopellis radicata]